MSQAAGDPLAAAAASGERRAFGWWLDRVLPVLAVVVAVMLLRRTFRARQPLDAPPPPVTGAGAASTGPPGVFDRRQKELVRRNNLYEPVRNLMREFFDSVGAPPNPGPKIPPLEISDAIRKPESLRQAIRDMWRIAYGPPQPISAIFITVSAPEKKLAFESNGAASMAPASNEEFFTNSLRF